jgi:hypothetical protein
MIIIKSPREIEQIRKSSKILIETFRLVDNIIEAGIETKKIDNEVEKFMLAFFISPVADNLTTALILSTVLLTIDRENKAFLVPGAINLVVAANAGGAWSPFGDITTLMVWI